MTELNEWQQQQCRSNKLLAVWTGLWVLTLALASFGPKQWWDSSIMTYVASVVNIIMGAAMIWANKRHLDHQDELQRKVQLEAMSLALGISVVLGLAATSLTQNRLLGFDFEISHLMMVLGVTYIVALLLGMRKYR